MKDVNQRNGPSPVIVNPGVFGGIRELLLMVQKSGDHHLGLSKSPSYMMGCKTTNLNWCLSRIAEPSTVDDLVGSGVLGAT